MLFEKIDFLMQTHYFIFTITSFTYISNLPRLKTKNAKYDIFVSYCIYICIYIEKIIALQEQ